MRTPLPQNRRAWLVCGLLLLASAINYMDRQTLANASVRITREFSLNQEQYGNLEAWFGYAFAAGSLFFGVLADRWPLRWLYAAVVALWSAAGYMTGFAESYTQLLVCRTALGFCEGGHWPCAIKATRLLLDARDRSLGNSVLQSGTSIGAIITPLLMTSLMTSELGSWRGAFQVIAFVGVAWIVLWLALVRKQDLVAPLEPGRDGTTEAGIWRLVFSRRMLVIFAVIACINTTWQVLRAWLPKLLQEGRGWSESHALYFNSAWFVATDIGCLGAGAAAVWLARRGMPVTRARMLVFAVCGLLVTAACLTPFTRSTPALMALLMIAGAGALGVFPIYHAFTQDISGSRQGRITGIASVAAWVLPALAQRGFGWLADTTGSFKTGFVIISFLPLAATLVLAIGWGRDHPEPS